ncbi:MAG: asparagine synthase-related protein [Chitinophagaceae bacterium]
MIEALFSAKWKKIEKGSVLIYYAMTSSDMLPEYYELSILDIEKITPEFAFVVYSKLNNKIQIITDRFNTVPVYFSYHDSKWYISDYAVHIYNEIPLTLDKDMIMEQIAFDCLLSRTRTIYTNLLKADAGQRIELNTQGEYEEQESISLALPTNRKEKLNEKEIQQIEEIILNSVKAYPKLYIPLSGGFDSRFVAGIIHNSNLHTIYSRTYGDAQSLDVKYATELAQRMQIEHRVVLKTDQEAIAEFEKLVTESAGVLNGVHAHDLTGRTLFENEGDAKVSGFIGDVLARGVNFREKETNKEILNKQFLKKRSNYFKYDYQKLFTEQNTIPQKVDDYIEYVESKTGHTEHLHWVYYQQSRIPNMVSLLEYFSHTEKPNIKPFINPFVAECIASTAHFDEWEGSNYVSIAQQIIPEFMSIPFSSNSVYHTSFSRFLFKAKKRVYQKITNKLAKWSKGTYQPLAFNATLNWRRILAKNKEWVSENLNTAATFLSMNKAELDTIYKEHCLGLKDHQEFLLRIIHIGVMLKNNTKTSPTL